MSYAKSEIAVGAFLLAGVGVILFGIFTIRGYAIGTTRLHHAYYRNVNTIARGSAVKFNGMMVGRVQEVSVDPAAPERIRVDFDVIDKPGIKITDRMHAKITKADLLGDEFIDIRVKDAVEGSPEALSSPGVELRGGSEIPAGEPFDLQRALEDLQETIGKVDELVAEAADQATQALTKVNAILTDAHLMVSEENRALVTRALADLAQTGQELRGMVAGNRGRIDAIFRSVDETAGNFERASGDLAATVDELRPDLHRISADLQAAVATLQETLDHAARTLDGVDVAQVNEVVENLDTASRHLADFTREIKERPYRLIRKEKRPPKEFQ